MGKVSIGLRGWRFDEEDVFTDEGTWRPLEEIPKEPRHRLVRLQVVIGRPCHACYLIHGEEDKRRCREAAIVYGEPLEEVLLCEQHEPDFLYWFREEGGEALAGEEGLKDEFHEWFADGGRAPDGYAGVEHVETDPTALPDLPDPEEIYERELEFASTEGDDAGTSGTVADASGADTSEADDGEGDEDRDDDEPTLEDLGLDREYPR